MSHQADSLSFLSALAAWGLLGLLLCSMVEKLLPIIPSGGMFIMLGMFGVPHLSDLPWAVAVTAAGSTVGSLFWYALGRWFGPERGDSFVSQLAGRLDVGSEWYWRLKERYRHHRHIVTFVGQIVPVVRAYLAFPAGVLAVPARSFVVATFFGATIWNTPFLISGYMLRKRLFDQGVASVAAFAAIALAYPLLFMAFRLAGQAAKRLSP